MKVTPSFIQGGVIGLNAKVVRSTNPSYVSISGRVIDETRNTLTIRQGNEDRIVVKNVSVFHFTTTDGTVIEVDGKVVVGRPENHLKKRPRRRW